MVAMPPCICTQLIENPTFPALARQRVADRSRLGHCPALGQCQPHHLGLPRPSLTDQVGAPHARISDEATKSPFTRISDESTRWRSRMANRTYVRLRPKTPLIHKF